ncbi:MAG: TonB-dependent receptor [Gammaproteobacteria bacterium]|nr:TonB-dependent receptor [Gammaproteobacteria bacterium]
MGQQYRHAAAILIGAQVCGATTYAQAQTGGAGSAEEMVVTGTFIRRSDFQQSSPVDVFDTTDFKVDAPQHLAYFFNDLPYNMNGSIAQSRGNLSGGGTINLRNLGSSATLVLVDTRRTASYPLVEDNSVDINTLLPSIMIDRIEILKDGASALYGTDAVGGVVNFLTRDDFSGFEISARGSMATYNQKGDQQISAIWGGGIADTHVVAAFEYQHQDLVQGTEMKWDRDRVANTSLGGPGTYQVPRRDAGGVLTGSSTNRPDADCDRIPGSSTVGTRCFYNFWPAQADYNEIDRFTAFITAKKDITDRISLRGDFAYTDMLTQTLDSPAASLAVPITIPGHHPANPYRAATSGGSPLYAVSSGIGLGYDKDGDGFNEFLPQRMNGNPYDLASPVMLTGTPTVAGSGVPFWEDVGYTGRALGTQGGLPTGGSLGEKLFTRNRPTQHYADILRATMVLDGSFGDDWYWETGAVYSTYHLHTNYIRNDTNVPEFRAALAGFGGAGCNPATGVPGQGSCVFFNPFGSSVFATPGTILANTQDEIDRVQPTLWDDSDSKLFSVDGTVSKEFEDLLPAGALGLALGFQYRDIRLKTDYDVLKNLGQTDRGAVQSDLNASRDTWAFFGEVNVPLFDDSGFGSLELSAAVRHEDSGTGLKTTDPKVGLLYDSPGGMWTLRGSWGESFLAPSLYQNYVSTTRLANVDDAPVSAGGTGVTNLRVTINQRGNPNLTPQTSKAYTFGVAVRPLEGLRLDLGYWNFKFKGQLQTESAQAILNADPLGSKVIRDPLTNEPLIIQVAFFNAGFVEVAGIDFEADWNHSLGDWGDINLNVLGTYVPTYKVRALPTSPTVDASDSNNVGVLGADTSIDWRVNSRLSWLYGNHTLSMFFSYSDSFKNTGTGPDNYDSWTPLDVTYRYVRDTSGIVNGYELSLGLQNVLNEQPQLTNTGAVAGGVYRNEGRIVWASVLAKF